MLNLPDNLSINQAPNPVARVMPVLAVDTIGSVLQELNARAEQFVKGQAYVAQVVSKLDDKAYLVKVENALLKMELGNSAHAGQTLVLRYIQDNPVPTFLLTQTTAPTKASESSAQLSPAAHLIGQYLKEAETNGSAQRLEATTALTHTPKNAEILAQNLKHAISNSGLFYESHLDEVVQGARPFATLMQEPQNQSGTHIPSLISQQLAVLENQRLSWHGEVWPGQKMDWEIQVKERSKNTQESQVQDAVENRPISSELTLSLPHLGKITAKLNLVDGHININIYADEVNALRMQTASLSQAIMSGGLRLDALTVAKHE